MKKSLYLILTVFAAVLFFSCASDNFQELPYEMTALEIVQQAQTAHDSGNNEQALFYYETLLKRYGTDTAVYVEGRFEIAHIYIQQKKYTEAQEILQDILDIYSSVGPGVLPGAYRKLSEVDLAKIPAKTKE